MSVRLGKIWLPTLSFTREPVPIPMTPARTFSQLRKTLHGLLWFAGISAAIIALLAGSLWLDTIPFDAARPPEYLKTLEEFRAWKKGAILREQKMVLLDVRYTVIFAPAGRYLESGPSAYLFDEKGLFVDWTSDSGDFPTAKLGLKFYKAM